MKGKNRFGLSRKIPSNVAREVRRKCGFGCVVCGMAFYDYEHVDPLFKDARTHEVENIVLLCSNCHRKVTSKAWSKETVSIAAHNPKALQEGYSFEAFDLGRTHPIISFGQFTIKNTATILSVEGVDLLTIKPPEVSSRPYRLSALFMDSKGSPTLEIENNHWKAYSSNWDVEVVGPRIVIREKLRHIALQIKALPPTQLIIERLQMQYGGYSIIVKDREMVVNMPNGRTISGEFSTLDNCKKAISIARNEYVFGEACKQVGSLNLKT